MERSRWKTFSGFAAAVAMGGWLCAPVWGDTQPAQSYPGQQSPQMTQQQFRRPQPPPAGTVNYVEGQALIGGQALAPNSLSSGMTVLAPGQVLSTGAGRAEILLTPGVFFRMSNNSAVMMVTPGLENTVVMLQKGRALVEVDSVLPENNIMINQNGMSTRILRPGLYDFDADHGAVRVFDGKASIQANGQTVEVNGDHQLMALAVNGKSKEHKFDKKSYQDDFYRWASLRSSYLTEANVDAARRYAGGAGYAPGLWAGTGWYWDPWFDAYTFIPGEGIFFNPFGWGFYSPWYAFGAPFGYGFYGGFHHFGPGYRPPVAAGVRGFGATGHASSFHGGAAGGFQGRGFGAAGGMRGGFAGGMHGGGGGHR